MFDDKVKEFKQVQKSEQTSLKSLQESQSRFKKMEKKYEHSKNKIKDLEEKIVKKQEKIKVFEMQKQNDDLASKIEYEMPNNDMNELAGLEIG